MANQSQRADCALRAGPPGSAHLDFSATCACIILSEGHPGLRVTYMVWLASQVLRQDRCGGLGSWRFLPHGQAYDKMPP